MKIAKIELFKVPQRWLFLKITTDDGIEGWGEPVVEGKARQLRRRWRKWLLISLGETRIKLKISGKCFIGEVFTGEVLS